MKQYFAKYLPVEEKIRGGTIVKWANYEFVQVSQAQINNSCDIKQFTADGKSYKPFLCSRDIQVGDKINVFIDSNIEDAIVNSVGNAELNIKVKETNGLYPKEKAFKIVGEISPDALLYIKEGMEFGKEDIQLHTSLKRDGEDCPVTMELWNNLPHEIKRRFIKIKGPCGHFH